MIRTQAMCKPLPTFVCYLSVALAVLGLTKNPEAQSFSSGSDGSDGALNVPPSAGTIVFNPMDVSRWGRVLDPDGDGVYHFTTITIGASTTLKLTGDRLNTPLYWLASGNVVIDGTLDLSGGAATPTLDANIRRQLAIPGPGGFAGGAGGLRNNCAFAATAGEGPGGGAPGAPCDGNYRNAQGGTFTGNRYLIPLIGGSGGGGPLDDGYIGGGAGGGAILIASSTSIAVNGWINAVGGSRPLYTSSACTGGGSGGAIRLVAPTLTGNGHLNVTGGGPAYGCGGGVGGPGMVRLEGFAISNSFVFDAGTSFYTRGAPVDAASLKPSSLIRVTAIGGVSVPANPTGLFSVPDAVISSNSPVSIDIQATGIPPGTVVTLTIYPQTPTDNRIVNLPTTQATLSGTLQTSTATTTVTFPYGFSRGYVRASWTQ